MIAASSSATHGHEIPQTISLSASDISRLCPGLIRLEVIHPEDHHVLLPVSLEGARPGNRAGAWAIPVKRLVRDFPPACLADNSADRLETWVDVYQAPDDQQQSGSSPGGVLLRGVDLNTASVQDLVHRLDGVGRRLAERIIEYRSKAGPFTCLADLTKVQGVGPQVFEKLTGVRSQRAGKPTTRELALRVIAREHDGAVDLRRVATRFRQLDGFDGCILVDHDGDVVASTWSESPHEAIGVFAPQLLRKLNPYLKSIDGGQVDMVSIFVSGRPFTLIPFGSLILIAVHETDRYSRHHLELAKTVAHSLERELFEKPAQA